MRLIWSSDNGKSERSIGGVVTKRGRELHVGLLRNNSQKGLIDVALTGLQDSARR